MIPNSGMTPKHPSTLELIAALPTVCKERIKEQTFYLGVTIKD
jgi:hypothetical protein